MVKFIGSFEATLRRLKNSSTMKNIRIGSKSPPIFSSALILKHRQTKHRKSKIKKGRVLPKIMASVLFSPAIMAETEIISVIKMLTAQNFFSKGENLGL